MTFIDNASPTTGDLAELYGLLAERLEQIVRVDVRAPDAVIEDACQFAWSRLLHHRHRVHREKVMSWLARTAVHEALKLLRRDDRELSLDAGHEQALPAGAAGGAAVEAVAENRERLGAVGRLPERQQRVLWLHALGFSYAEIARREGCTVRTVDRQLLRARAKLREEGPLGAALP